MDMFRRELAPITAEAWSEIESRAKEVLLTRLTGRKVVRVVGPQGIDYTAVGAGRLVLVEEGELSVGRYQVMPLTEARINFTLNKWELDNLARGAKDIDFDNLDRALEKLALFEEQAIYFGYAKGGIKGLKESSAHPELSFGSDANSILASIANGVLLLQKSFIAGPYSLVVDQKAWLKLNSESHGMSLLERVERMLGSKVILATASEGAFLIPFDNENLELTIGQDFTLGYQAHDTKEVTLFATESFAFRVLDEAAVVSYK